MKLTNYTTLLSGYGLVGNYYSENRMGFASFGVCNCTNNKQVVLIKEGLITGVVFGVLMLPFFSFDIHLRILLRVTF